jgi:DNA polymerase III delta subunit
MKLIPSAEITGSRFIAAGSYYFVSSAVSSIIQAQVERGAFEQHSYYENSTPIPIVLNELLTEPLFDDFKIVIFHLSDPKDQKDGDDAKKRRGEGELKQFKCDFKGVFVITSESVEAAERLSKLLPNFKLLLEKKLSPVQVNKAIQIIFSEQKFNISYNAADRVSKAFEADMALIASEVEKLALYYHKSTPKSEEELLNHILVGFLHEDRWKFIDALFTGKTDDALKILSGLQEREEAAANLFYTIPAYYAGIYFPLAHPKVNIYKVPTIKAKGFILKRAAEYARSWSVDRIEKAISRHRELEVRIKTSNLSYFDALILLLEH